ncbi:MAG TPA: hypothetical protein VHP83_11930, partial [Aggregatilineaceae bacterium]|nr:hypothetical protein [Aggregatilineaceae bacterium]
PYAGRALNGGRIAIRPYDAAPFLPKKQREKDVGNDQPHAEKGGEKRAGQAHAPTTPPHILPKKQREKDVGHD